MLSTRFVAATREYCTFEKHVPAPLMRKNFYLQQIPNQARITICGLGFYRLFVNGHEITRSYLAPYISNPDQVLYYDGYDIAEYLQVGNNTIGVVLGNGFLNNMGGFIWSFDQASFRSAPKAAFSLQLDQLVMEADESVKVHSSPITFNDLRAGEHYDARQEIQNWCSPDLDDSTWDNAILAECPLGERRYHPVDPIRVTEVIAPVRVWEGEGGYIYDFGKNTAGIVKMQLEGREGQQLKLVFSEVVNDGKSDMENISFDCTLPDYNQCVKYICKEGLNIYQPSFCYMGFRYVYVSGITKEQAKESLLTMLVMHSDVKKLCAFSCSDESVNRVYENTGNSTLSNLYHIPTDCPQREKNGWTGDANLCAEQMLLNYDVAESLREWLFNIRKAQKDNGKIPCVIPTTGWGYEWGTGPAWDGVLVELPYRIYQFTGDTAVIMENADSMFNYLTYMETRRREDGLFAYGLGDWCQVNIDNVENYTTPLCVTDTLYCMTTCKRAALLYQVIGQTERAKYCLALYEDVRRSFRQHCIEPGQRVLGDTQTGQAMALFYDAFEEEEKKEAVEVLVTLIKDEHFDVGVLGNRVLFRVLAEYGYADLAHKLITQPTFPSFEYQLQLGATSLWESFYELGEDYKPVSGTKVDILSQNHYFWGDIAAFFVEYFAGLQINPHVKDIYNIEICPHPVKKMTWAKCRREMPYGEIGLEWSMKKNEFLLQVQIPEGAYGTIVLPNGEKKTIEIGKNTYRVVI